jgi:hypothetical protein
MYLLLKLKFPPAGIDNIVSECALLVRLFGFLASKDF